MNRTELAEAVSSRTGLDRKLSEAAVEAVTGAIVEEVRAGNRVSIFGFGSFEPKARAARTARNPQTQQVVKVPASKGVGFKPASAFKEALNKGRAGGAKKASGASKASATKKASKAPAGKKAAASRKSTAKSTKATKATKKR